jgi:nitrate reductase (cytochrome), electron transfer subunit
VKKSNNFLFSLSLAILIVAIVLGVGELMNLQRETGTEPKQEQPEKQPTKKIDIPQLNEERADAATMVLISAPPLQPLDHIDRWKPELLHQSCLMCHETDAAREIPISHYTDQDRSKGIFGPRSVCITCHAQQSGDMRPAFNREN